MLLPKSLYDQNTCILISVMELERLHAAKSTLNTTVVEIVQELEQAQLPAMKAKEHAEVLRRRVCSLFNLFTILVLEHRFF